MKSSDSFIPSTALAILLVGPPGSGKTRTIMSFPDPGILDCDGNLASAVRVAKGKKFWYSQPFVTDDGKEVPEVDRWNRAVAETKSLLVSSETKSFIVDGLSNLCRWGLIHAEAELVKAGINVKKEYLAKYQAFIPLLTNYLTMIRLAGKYVLVTVHQVMEKDELSGRVMFKLDIPGRLADNLGGQFTDVWGTNGVEDPTNAKIGATYTIRTKPSGYHVALKTSLDLEPSINVTGKTPQEIWSLLEPRLSVNVKPPTPQVLPAAIPAVTGVPLKPFPTSVSAVAK